MTLLIRFIEIGLIAFLLMWAWYGLYCLIHEIRFRMIVRKYRKRHEKKKGYERILDNNIPDMIKDFRRIN